VLCDMSNFEGGTWNKDGVILFSSGGVIQRVAAAGRSSDTRHHPGEHCGTLGGLVLPKDARVTKRVATGLRINAQAVRSLAYSDASY
jgi:hypothetical protein